MIRRLTVSIVSITLAACNMLVSEKPMFADSDRSGVLPEDGVWLAQDPECVFDIARPTSSWPDCAIWVVSQAAGNGLHLHDGKGEDEQIAALFTGSPPTLIVEAKLIDEKEKPPKSAFAYYALEPSATDGSGRFRTAVGWSVDCGIQEEGSSRIEHFPGVTEDCQPSSKEVIRAAATSSRLQQKPMTWKWLRADDQVR